MSRLLARLKNLRLPRWGCRTPYWSAVCPRCSGVMEKRSAQVRCAQATDEVPEGSPVHRPR